MRHNTRRAQKHNQAFMWGMMAMAFIVLVLAALFLEWSFVPKS